MKTMNFKTAVDGTFVIAHPNAKPGWQPGGSDCHVTQVTDIPDDVSPWDVIRLLDGTVNVSWLFDDQAKPHDERGRSVLRYDELGIGRMIRA